MKRLLLETSFSKIYMIVMILITLLVVGGYFSYAMFTVSKEKSNAISIVTGNLTYKLEVDGEETNTLTVDSNTVKDFTVTLSNPNNRVARFNFYYEGELDSYTKVGYIVEEEVNIPPDKKGINLEKNNTLGSSNIYKIRVINNSENSTTINLGVEVGLDYNDLELPSNGNLLEEITTKGEVGTVVLDDISKDSIYNDGENTFITGKYPNNYIWYSGKLWRAVSVDTNDNSVKLVTQWNMSAIPYCDGNSSAFEGSYIKEWLNDTSVDGFLYNLREPENFIKMDSEWNATMMTTTDKPPKTTMVTSPVGLLNLYEFTMSYRGTTSENGYLNNTGLYYFLTPASSTSIYVFNIDDYQELSISSTTTGIRPSVNLKPGIMTVDGRGTEDDPYRLEGDNDSNLSGTLLNTRYSGEYISFGTGENNLYRIVSHENGSGTKITSAEPLKKDGAFVTIDFGDDNVFSSSNSIGTFLNNDYLNPSNGYLTSDQINMIEDNTTWYLGGTTNYGWTQSYRITKYTSATSNTLTSSRTNAKVGLLRLGELLAAQGNVNDNNSAYWLLTPVLGPSLYHNYVHFSRQSSYLGAILSSTSGLGIKPSFNLKNNVVIESGSGTKNLPFKLSVK